MTPQEVEKTIEFLLDSHASLTVKVEANTEAIAKLTVTVERIEKQAEADRTEIRSAINAMLGFAEAMGENVKLLTRIQQGASKRASAIEKRVERLEKPKK